MTSDQTRTIKNLVYFFYLINGMPNARKIYNGWYSHPALKDYPRPNLEQLDAWCAEFVEQEERQ